VTLTLTRWPSYTNLIRIPWRYIRCTKMNFLRQSFLSYYGHTDRQIYIRHRFAGGPRWTIYWQYWPMRKEGKPQRHRHTPVSEHNRPSNTRTWYHHYQRQQCKAVFLAISWKENIISITGSGEVTDWVKWHRTGRLGNESSQALNCTAIDNQSYCLSHECGRLQRGFAAINSTSKRQ